VPEVMVNGGNGGSLDGLAASLIQYLKGGQPAVGKK